MLILATRCTYYIVRETCLMAYHVFWREPWQSVECLFAGICSSEDEIEIESCCSSAAIPQHSTSGAQTDSVGNPNQLSGSQAISRRSSVTRLFTPQSLSPTSHQISTISNVRTVDQSTEAKPRRKSQQTNTELQTKNTASLTNQSFPNPDKYVEKQDKASRTDLIATPPVRHSYSQVSAVTTDVGSSTTFGRAPRMTSTTSATTVIKKVTSTKGTNTPVAATTTENTEVLPTPTTGTSAVVTSAVSHQSLSEDDFLNQVASELRGTPNARQGRMARNVQPSSQRSGTMSPAEGAGVTANSSGQQSSTDWCGGLPENVKEWIWLLAYAALFLFLVLHLVFLGYHYNTIQKIRNANNLQGTPDIAGAGDASITQQQGQSSYPNQYDQAKYQSERFQRANLPSKAEGASVPSAIARGGLIDPRNETDMAERASPPPSSANNNKCEKTQCQHKTYDYYDCMHNNENDGSSFEKCLHIA